MAHEIEGAVEIDAGALVALFAVVLETADKRIRWTEPEIAHAGIGRKFQKPTVFENHTVFENLELAMKTDKRVWASVRARLSAEQLDRISETLELIKLQGEADRLAGLLSHGQKQWVEIGMLLMQEPRLLLLVEPVAGMTVEETERTAQLFQSLAGERSSPVSRRVWCWSRSSPSSRSWAS